MSEKPTRYMDLDNNVHGDDGSMVMPYGIRVLLTEESIDKLERARMAYRAASELCAGEMVWDMRVGFPHVEYLKDGGEGAVPWGGEFSVPSVCVRDTGIEFVAYVPNTDMTMQSGYVSWAELDEEIRQWRAQALGQAIEGAMSSDSAPALRKAGGMSPL